MVIVTTCGNSEKIAKGLAKKLKCTYSPLTIKSFPDGDIYLKFNTSLKGKKLVIVQSFQPNPDMSLFDVIFAAEAAKDQGAKKIILVAPYLAFMRQDKAFNSGECVSSRVMARLLNRSIDKIITIDPHLHRYKSLKDIFTIPSVRLTANSLLAGHIKKNLRNEVIIGPDWESYQWAESVANEAGADVSVLKKERFSSRLVRVKMIRPVAIEGKTAVIVDDIISTGHTIIEAAKKAMKMGAKSVVAVAVHGLFAEGALEKIKKAGIREVITTNTIIQKTSRIDISSLIFEELAKDR